MNGAWFSGWGVLLRTVLVGVTGYATLVLLLRISGKRTLAKMNAFDLVVTVALGSTLAALLTSNDVSYAQGALAFLLLVWLQIVVTWLSVRSRHVRDLVRAEPTLLLHRGQVLERALRRTRITHSEVEAAVRRSGLSHITEVHAVVLETDGSLSVLPERTPDHSSADDALLPLTSENTQH